MKNGTTVLSRLTLACKITVLFIPLFFSVNVFLNDGGGIRKAWAEEAALEGHQEKTGTKPLNNKQSPKAVPSYIKLDGSGNQLPDSASDWSMVKDNSTGLVWEVKTDDGTIHDRDNAFSWQQAEQVLILKLNSDEFGGYSDWRLPTINELSTIVDKQSSFPSINKAYFPATTSSYYWSGTDFPNYPGYARVINFSHGNPYDYPKSDRYYVRGVRSDQR